MRVLSLIREGESALEKSGNEDASFDARQLYMAAFGVTREKMLMDYDSEVPDGPGAQLFLGYIARRAAHEPLQYILGRWEFYSFPFYVGEGVLIPRQETEMLVDLASAFIEGFPVGKERPVVFDLCSGSGAVGLTLAKLFPGCSVCLFERSAAANGYAERSRRDLRIDNARIMEYDIFRGFDPALMPVPDAVISNPPYVRSGEIDGLAQEISHEPRMAFDGGNDGLVFYRAIAGKWLDALPAGGFAAVECDDFEAPDIMDIFTRAGLEDCVCAQAPGGSDVRMISARGRRRIQMEDS